MHRHDTIDRISPTLEPDQPVLLHQNWHHLLFLHWEVPVAELQSLLPVGLTVDTFEGKAFVGLVPFTLTGVRPVMVPPLPWISSFHEINVRTYVHLGGRDPGVWFFSLDASSAIAVAAARAAYKLPYFGADIDFRVQSGAIPSIEFDARRTDERGTTPATARMRYQPVEGPATASAPGTLEHFLIERYILYAEDEQRQLHRARVHHQPYPVQRVDVDGLEETLIWAAGIKRHEQPAYRHYASEVNVNVYPLERC
ncbi:MAG TPA: DUF2071 domain-containing protein [Thermoanaerobaculia bacterium]|nr:DUF2071 domain-containing protein [Thermoanaerobaculia bacterium]